MAGSYNKLTIIGNLGRDPESRFLPDGTQVTNFSVATTERWTNKDRVAQERTTWFRVSAFGKLAETCSGFLRKGSYVYIEGGLSAQEYTDREGNLRTSLEVRCREMRMLDKRGEGNGNGDGYSEDGPQYAGRNRGTAQQSAQIPPEPDNMDDIPF